MAVSIEELNQLHTDLTRCLQDRILVHRLASHFAWDGVLEGCNSWPEIPAAIQDAVRERQADLFRRLEKLRDLVLGVDLPGEGEVDQRLGKIAKRQKRFEDALARMTMINPVFAMFLQEVAVQTRNWAEAMEQFHWARALALDPPPDGKERSRLHSQMTTHHDRCRAIVDAMTDA